MSRCLLSRLLFTYQVCGSPFLRSKYSTTPLQCHSKYFGLGYTENPVIFTKPLPLPSTCLPKYTQGRTTLGRFPELPSRSPKMTASKKGEITPPNRLKADGHLWRCVTLSRLGFVVVLCASQKLKLCYLCGAPPSPPLASLLIVWCVFLWFTLSPSIAEKFHSAVLWPCY